MKPAFHHQTRGTAVVTDPNQLLSVRGYNSFCPEKQTDSVISEVLLRQMALRRQVISKKKLVNCCQFHESAFSHSSILSLQRDFV